jgi:hypothetical protein
MRRSVLDHIFALDDVQAVGYAAQVHTAEVAAQFAANATGA